MIILHALVTGTDMADGTALILRLDQLSRIPDGMRPHDLLSPFSVYRKGKAKCIHRSFLLSLIYQRREPVLHIGARVQDAHLLVPPPLVRGHFAVR